MAGLQAIATAKRLGARVTAFDTREEALEQAESLGAKALRIDLGETGATDQGYAKELPPEQLENIFERFVQVRRTDGPPAIGHGLGLAICRSIARLHGGEVSAANRTDRSGLCLTVDLPA